MIKETYLALKKRTEKEYPDAVMIVITRTAGHPLSPSWNLLNDYDGGITWEEYTRRFLIEIDNDRCRLEIKRIAELAKLKDVYLICYEKPPKHCHRYIILDMVKKAME